MSNINFDIYLLPGNWRKGPIKVKQREILDYYPLWSNIYRVEADITVIALPKREELNVFHFTQSSACCNMGDRIPAVYVNNAGYFDISSGVNNNGNYKFKYNFTLGKKYHIAIQQYLQIGKNFIYRIEVNGQIVHTVQNYQPNNYTDVKVYASDPWNIPLSSEYGLLENFKISSDLDVCGKHKNYNVGLTIIYEK